MLLGNNQFIAVLRRKAQIMEKLKQASLFAFWRPPWTWNHAEGQFKISEQEHRPELTISFTQHAEESSSAQLMTLCKPTMQSTVRYHFAAREQPVAVPMST